MKRKIQVILLSICLITGILNGCQGRNTAMAEATPTPTTVNAQEEAQTTATEQSDQKQTVTKTPTKAEYLASIKRAAYTNTNRPLTNKNASQTTLKVYNYLFDTYGKNIISGQQESTWMGSSEYEMDIIYKASSKLPSIRGLDFMNDDFNGVVDRANAWWKQGGLVTICWHCGSDFGGSWSECMKSDLKNWNKSLKKGTKEYKALIAGMDKAAKPLLQLQKDGVPVLWRPFHELDGGWFWWSKGDSKNFKKLWKIMYDRYTNHWGLNNLIWVFGYSGNGVGFKDWYPGDKYVDIAGADSYNRGSQVELYKKVISVVGERKPVVFHECGTIPSVAELKNDGAKWLWFMTWHTDFVSKESNNSKDSLNAIYNDDYVITLDELPSFQ